MAYDFIKKERKKTPYDLPCQKHGWYAHKEKEGPI